MGEVDSGEAGLEDLRHARQGIQGHRYPHLQLRRDHRGPVVWAACLVSPGVVLGVSSAHRGIVTAC